MSLRTVVPRFVLALAPFVLALTLLGGAIGQATASSDNSAVVNLTPVIYANDQLYGTVVATNTDFSQAHPQQSLDTLYTFETQLSVADAAPGDPGFNGGRWAVQPVTWNVAPYLITNAADVLAAAEAGHVTIGEPARFFVCTLIPLG